MERGGSLILLVTLIFFDSVCGLDYLTEKPSFLESCKIYEPGFTKCSTESTQRIWNELTKNTGELNRFIGALDPMTLDNIEFKQDNNEAATVRANLTDLIITGFSNLKVVESKVSKKDFGWQTKVFLPKMRMDGNYKMAGKILLIPLSGSGKMFLEIENLDILMHTKTRLYEKGGFTFYNVTEVRVNLDMSGVRSNFENIFNGNSKEVERSTNEFFNQNWREFFEALRPLVTDTVERVLTNILRKLFSALPANFLVEDIPTSEKLYGKSS